MNLVNEQGHCSVEVSEKVRSASVRVLVDEVQMRTHRARREQLDPVLLRVVRQEVAYPRGNSWVGCQQG